MGGAAVHPVLRRAHGAAESGAGAVLPYAAHRVFRRHRQRAWDRMAGGGLAGAAQFSGSGTERDAARSLNVSAHRHAGSLLPTVVNHSAGTRPPSGQRFPAEPDNIPLRYRGCYGEP